MTPEQASAVRDVLVGAMEQESATTKRVLEAVPSGNRDYKPDPKSRTAWELAVHLATAEMWFADAILSGKFEWAGEAPTPAEMVDPASVAAWYARESRDRFAKLRAMSAAELLRPVDFFGTTAPDVTWIAMMNNHSIHHRGQLAAYLRAAGSKVPAIYGVSADESLFT